MGKATEKIRELIAQRPGSEQDEVEGIATVLRTYTSPPGMLAICLVAAEIADRLVKPAKK